MRLRGLVAGLAAAMVSACGGAAGTVATTVPGVDVRLGYLPNLTHAPALVGVQSGAFKEALGPRYPLTTATFNAGPDLVQALLSNSIDAGYLGPSPAVTAFVQSHGEAIRVVAGAGSGGASLVVRPTINSAGDLKGKTIATPQLGNTQDVALRYWLRSKGLKASGQEPGDVTVQPTDNATALQAYRLGQLDGAWVPEPWASRFVIEGGAKVLVDESSLWPNGRFATTLLAVRTDFLKAHSTAVSGLLQAQVKIITQLAADPTAAQKAANAALATAGKALSDAVLASAWSHVAFTNDPLAATVETQAQHQQQVGLLARVDLRGLFDVTLLNRVLSAHGQPAVGAG